MLVACTCCIGLLYVLVVCTRCVCSLGVRVACVRCMRVLLLHSCNERMYVVLVIMQWKYEVNVFTKSTSFQVMKSLRSQFAVGS